MKRTLPTSTIKLSTALVAAACIYTGPAMAAGNHNHQHEDLNYLFEQEKTVTNIFNAYFPDLETGRKAAISFHGQLFESHYDDGYLVMQLDADEMAKLEAFGFTFKTASDFLMRRDAHLNAIQNQPLALMNSTENSAALAGIPGYECYETVEETFSAAQQMVVDYPNLATWTDVGNSWEKNNTAGGFDIFVLKLTNKTITGDKPKLFANSAIHAREYTTAPLNLDFARWLVEGYGNNADATWILDHHEVHLMLQTNPDGRKEAETQYLKFITLFEGSDDDKF